MQARKPFNEVDLHHHRLSLHCFELAMTDAEFQYLRSDLGLDYLWLVYWFGLAERVVLKQVQVQVQKMLERFEYFAESVRCIEQYCFD